MEIRTIGIDSGKSVGTCRFAKEDQSICRPEYVVTQLTTRKRRPRTPPVTSATLPRSAFESDMTDSSRFSFSVPRQRGREYRNIEMPLFQ
jgi:hypothetical protein